MASKKIKPVLLDTCVMISFFEGNKKNEQIKKQVLKLIREDRVAISVITRAELFYYPKFSPKDSDLKKFFNNKIYNLELEISRKFIELIHDYPDRSARWIPDALIAATALYHGLELYTENRRDFVFIAGLRLYNPPDLRP